MRIATANLGRGVSTDVFRDNVRKMVNRLRGAIVCFQEIDEADLPPERRILGLRMRRSWWFAGRRTAVMIAVPKTWVRLDEKVIQASKGVAGVTPDRKLVSTLIRSRVRKQLHPIAVLNIHFPYVRSGLNASDHRRASDAWESCFAALVAETSRRVDLQNTTTFICMDGNKIKMPKPHPDARLLLGEHGIDKIWVVERSVDVRLLATGMVDMTIDNHNGHVARVALK